MKALVGAKVSFKKLKFPRKNITRGGFRRLYRLVDFSRYLWNVLQFVVRIEYDPFRTAFIALTVTGNGIISYILAPINLDEGERIIAGKKIRMVLGNSTQLRMMTKGMVIYNLELIE
jgi:large subunit ribosomal protein L2